MTPIDGDEIRLCRMGMLAEILVDRGHEVLWWNTTFFHHHRQQRFAEDTTITIRDGYQIRFLHACGYTRGASVQRVFNNRQLAKKFLQQSKAESNPDIILSSFPPIDTALAATAYGRENQVPVVVDLRDMWPDIILFHTPWYLKPLMRAAVTPMNWSAVRACKNASALAGITDEFLDWGLGLAGRRRSARDLVVPHSYARPTISNEKRQKAEEFWKNTGLSEDSHVVTFIGGVGNAVDLQPVVDAAKLVQNRSKKIQFVVAGTGSGLPSIRKYCADHKVSNVIFAGWVDVPEIDYLLRKSSVGLAPWKPTPDYEATISNKIVEYFSQGLPVVTSLHKGVLSNLIDSRECGFKYDGPDQLADRLISLSRDGGELLKKLSASASAIYFERFEAHRVLGSFADHLEMLSGATCNAAATEERTIAQESN